jgi:phenylpyruvate tautomerase PptA (4-oxalocrotonate tautomerase family)
MPHLQLDVSEAYPAAVKRALAKRFGEIYAEIMQTTPDIVDVSVRELGEGGHWRCTYGAPVPAAVLSCVIRRGRPPEQRARLGEALIDACVAALGLDPLLLTVEFTQHAGDEIYGKQMIDGILRGGLAKDWSPEETQTPLMEILKAEQRAKG